MKKQIKDLTLWEVDYLVAKAEGIKNVFIEKNECLRIIEDPFHLLNHQDFVKYSPTANPAKAWPIIERDRISLDADNIFYNAIMFSKDDGSDLKWATGKTSLEAAMRCKLASVYGDWVEI